MANGARVTTGNLPRMLQYGLDKILDHLKDTYKGPGSMIFKDLKTEKAYFEAMQLAGAGLAALKGEGTPISTDSVDQNWVYRWPVYCYEKSFRVTFEAIDDNLYDDLIARFGKEQAKALQHTKDYLQAAVFNNAFADTARPDGKVLCASDHPLQAGSTADNTVSLDMSEDAIEQMVIKANKIKSPDGLFGSVETRDIIVPVDLRFETDRVVSSKYRSGTPDNDISAIYNQGVINRVIPWKRLSDTDAFFITTNAEDGFTQITRQAVKTDSFKEPTTKDIIVSAYERYTPVCLDFRAVIGSAGA